MMTSSKWIDACIGIGLVFLMVSVGALLLTIAMRIGHAI
jgi:hypothetical protein